MNSADVSAHRHPVAVVRLSSGVLEAFAEASWSERLY